MNFERISIEKLTFFLVIFLIYFSAIFRYYFGVVFLLVPLFLLVLCATTIILHIGIPNMELRKTDVTFSFILVLYLFIAVFIGTTTDTLIVLVIPLLALSVRLVSFCNIQYIFKVLVIIQASLMFYEVITLSFIYTVQIGDTIFDEKIMGGNIGIFRAKGLFEGPTVASIFLITAALFIGSQKKWLLCLLVLSLMTGGRTPVIIIGAIGAYLHVKNMIYSDNMLERITPIIALLFGIIWLTQFDMDYLVFDRLSQTTDFSASSNSARLSYWISSIGFFSNYDLIHLLFGNMGAYRLEFDNSTESGWIQILVDLGISGLLFFLLPFMKALWSNFNANALFFFSIMILSNFVFTFSFGVIGAFSYWLIIFCFEDICKASVSTK
ncbi:MAG TPA: hypothetical protein DEV59_11720 [Proteus sp.]|nr:hypothetical protein [Proteus sp. (in: enterobacteria)]